jgi:hypothetical protein
MSNSFSLASIWYSGDIYGRMSYRLTAQVPWDDNDLFTALQGFRLNIRRAGVIVASLH